MGRSILRCGGALPTTSTKFCVAPNPPSSPSSSRQSSTWSSISSGGLMSYGAEYLEMWRRAADYIDKILRGAKPAELPVEQPTKFNLVINLERRIDVIWGGVS